MEYVGGQNKSLIITCKESFLYSRSLTRIIDRFAPVPLLARIDPTVLEVASSCLKENKYLNISLQFYSKVSKTSFASVAPSSQSILSLNSDLCNYSIRHSSLAPSSVFSYIYNNHHSSQSQLKQSSSLAFSVDSDSSSLVHMKGESDYLLSYLPSLLHLSGLSKITITPRLTLLEKEEESKEYEFEGRW